MYIENIYRPAILSLGTLYFRRRIPLVCSASTFT